MAESEKYCIDTDALLSLWRRLYPKDVFTTLWINFEDLIDSGVVVSVREVLKELEQKDDDLSNKWAKKHKKMFIDPTAEELEKVKEIEKRFPKLVDHTKTKPAADPFVIASGVVYQHTVVSMEESEDLHKNPNAKPKIPNVCREYGVKCVRLLEFFREQKWNF